MNFNTYFHKEDMTYTGVELRPHFILSKFKIEGSSLIAFHGPCDVKTDDMVDWEDRMRNDHIRANRMIHFLGEFFGVTLREGVWIQRLMVSHIESLLMYQGIKMKREGDDIFVNSTEKLNVSIVTSSSLSVLLHLGINIDATGAPVMATGLNDIGVDAVKLTEDVLKWFKEEHTSVERACVKVRPVI